MMYVNFLVVIVALAVYGWYWQMTDRRLKAQNEKLEARNRELAAAKALADEAGAMKVRFGQLMKRQIKNPLQVIMGFSQVLDDFSIEISEDELHMMTKSIADNALRISRLVDKTLVMAESLSMTSLEMTDQVTARDLADQAADLSGIRGVKHVGFTIEASDGAGDIQLTTNRFYAIRALLQLLDNAVKFTRLNDNDEPNEGIGQLSKRDVWLRIQAADGNVSFAVEDTGIGVPASEAEHIFEEFVKLDDFREGTGIGLTVARRLARLLGGDIRLDTGYAPGARFVLTLKTGMKEMVVT